jgi:hypothetical protein
MQLEENQIVWTCCPTIECGYDERLEPRQVKLRLYRTIWYGHSFNHETGEIDKDPNATIVAKETNYSWFLQNALVHLACNKFQVLKNEHNSHLLPFW